MMMIRRVRCRGEGEVLSLWQTAKCHVNGDGKIINLSEVGIFTPGIKPGKKLPAYESDKRNGCMVGRRLCVSTQVCTESER